ncbi:hypothetical protein C0J52_19282 [Blattella germanica]|nr:hypothetical protein C0J52_19282 [Blattella germanica]
MGTNFNSIDIFNISAWHPKHEMTSWSSFESVFTFIQDQYKKLEDHVRDYAIQLLCDIFMLQYRLYIIFNLLSQI